MADATALETGKSKAKVFISYSRKDIGFADRLDSALKARGFETLIDRTDILAFEEWWKRIEVLIGRADTVVFVLSPDAVRPDSIARKEVAFAASLNKRFAPIVFRCVEDKAVPEELAKLNFIFFDDSTRFEQSADQLAEALNTDISWIRQHTDLGEQARRWALAREASGLLLRSPALEQAEQWIAARPSGAPAPTEVAQRFIRNSRQAATRRRNTLSGGLAAGLVLAVGLAGLAYWQRGIAVEQRDRAVQAEQTAVEQKQIAEQERDRATKTLAVSTRMANSLVNDLALEFRNRSGMPIDLVRNILERAVQLQEQLGESGNDSRALRYSEADAQERIAQTLLSLGDTTNALLAAERARDILEDVLANYGNSVDQNDCQKGVMATITEEQCQSIFKATADLIQNWEPKFKLASVYGEIGVILSRMGRLPDTVAAYEKAITLLEAAATNYPDISAFKELLVTGYEHLGKALLETGDQLAASEAFKKADALVAAAEPTHKSDQELILAAKYERIGDGQTGEQAIQAYQESVDLTKKLSAVDASNTEVLRALWNRLNKLADAMSLGHISPRAYTRQDHVGAAISVRRQALDVIEKLSLTDPNNMDWQRDLLVAHNRLGDLFLRANENAKALAAFREGLVIGQKLADRDPSNLIWTEDLTVSYFGLGAVALEDGRYQESIDYHRKSVDLTKALIAADAHNTKWQDNLAVDYMRIGKALSLLDKKADAIEAYHNSREIYEQLLLIDPQRAEWRGELAVVLIHLGLTGDEAEDRLAQALNILWSLQQEGTLLELHKEWLDIAEQVFPTLGK